jgi:site-specific recombinase XerD
MRQGIRAVTLRCIKHVTKPSGLVLRYLRYPGADLIRLPGGDMAAPEFLAAYAAAMIEAKAKSTVAAYDPATVAGAISDYLRSDAFKTLAETTRRAHRRHLTAVQGKAGSALLSDLAAKHIANDVRALGGHPGLSRLKAWRAFTKWATKQGRLAADPARTVARPDLPKSDGFPRWTDDEVAAFRVRWPQGTAERLAMEVLCWTGASAKDASRLGPGMVKGGALQFGRSKTGVPFTVPVANLPAWATGMADDWRHFLAAIQGHPHMTWIITEAGASRSHKAFSAWFAERARMAGVEKSAHGLRKYRAVALTEAGATKDQRKAWLGHLSDAESDFYAKGADQRAVLGLETATGNRLATGLKVVE